MRLWQFDKLAGVVGAGSSRPDHRRAHPQSRGVHRFRPCGRMSWAIVGGACRPRGSRGTRCLGAEKRRSLAPPHTTGSHTLGGTISAFLSRLSRSRAPLRVIGVELLICLFGDRRIDEVSGRNRAKAIAELFDVCSSRSGSTRASGKKQCDPLSVSNSQPASSSGRIANIRIPSSNGAKPIQALSARVNAKSLMQLLY